MELVVPLHALESALRQLVHTSDRFLSGAVHQSIIANQLLVTSLGPNGQQDGLAVFLSDEVNPSGAPDAAVSLAIRTNGSWLIIRRLAARSAFARRHEITSMMLPGKFMYRLVPDGNNAVSPRSIHVKRHSRNSILDSILRDHPTSPDGPLSRTASALGGWETLQRLQGLHIAVVGAGRNGSCVIEHLARLGVRALTIVDRDALQPSNLDAMSMAHPQDLSVARQCHKAAVLAHHVGELSPSTQVQVVLHWANHPAAINAMCTADVVISVPDNDAARFVAAVVSSIYLKPHLDIGSAVLKRKDGHRELGIDVRLTLPGQSRCLSCFGGLATVDDLGALVAGSPDPRDVTWRERRLGSLRSLTSIAAGLGMRALEDLVGGSQDEEGLWWRLTQAAGDAPKIVSGTSPRDPACPICAVAGEGDSALPRLPRILQSVYGRNTRHRPDSAHSL